MNLNLIRNFSNCCNSVTRNKTFSKISTNKHFKKPFTIIVEGNIGSGKTSFLQNFENNENILTLSEPVSDWKNVGGHDLLSLMYQDLKSWAFTFQTYVQLSMMKLHEQTTNKSVKLMERSLYSARYVFVENLKDIGALHSAQVSVLDEWFQWLINKNEFSVDLIVYLRTDPEIAYQRIKERCRTGEEYIQLDYVKKIHEYHEDWLYHKTKFSCPAPVLTLDANKDLNEIKKEYNHFQDHLQLLSSSEHS